MFKGCGRFVSNLDLEATPPPPPPPPPLHPTILSTTEATVERNTSFLTDETSKRTKLRKKDIKDSFYGKLFKIDANTNMESREGEDRRARK